MPPARSRAPIIGRNTHLDHVVCDDALSYCVPSAVHHKLADLLAPKHGGDREAAKEALLAWYPVVWAKLAPEFVMGDAFKFWQGQFDAMYATPRATAADPPQAVARPRNCKHDPLCVDDLAHTDRYRAELNQKKADGQKASA